ncbi:MAG TPA: TIGR01777 family oxidoreductase [Nocardioides sp.]|uniref:TIGR01777 family oxidoreductase n=1 Tax=Nocardioides sp. TaxID=35761 RepID=UPI002F40CA8B
MHVLVGGASGFLGRHLTAALRHRGHTTTSLVRREAAADDESRWDPATGQVDAQVVEDSDVVVNVAGSPTIGNPYSKRWADALRESRVTTTRTLAEAIAASPGRPAFLAGNAVAVYGDHGDHPVTEEGDSRGHTLMGEVTRAWQAAAQPAVEAGARVCVLRTAPVMDRESEPLRMLRRLYRLGAGGRLGSGRQYFPMVSLRDWLAAVVHLAEDPEASGPVNLCCPETPTMAEFNRALARAVGRPAVLPVPAPAIRIAAGPLAEEVLGSVNLVPAVLLDRGFEFRDRDVTAVVAAGLAGAR